MKFSILSANLLILMIAGCGDTGSQQNTTHTSQTARTSTASGWQVNPDGDLNNFFECLEAEGKTLISAHRAGSYDDYPENSLETAKFIATKIPAMHEIDVATSRDGVLFLMHDDTLERTTTGEGRAKDLNWDGIKNLRLEDRDGKATRFTPPTLEEFLRWSRDRAIVQIDFKRSTRFEDVIDLVEKLDAQNSVIYIAYSMAQARKLHRLAPDAMISVSVDSQSELNAAIAAGIPANKLLAFTGTQDPQPRLFSLLNNRDIEVIFGTLGGRNSIDRDIARGNDSITYTDLSIRGVDVIATDRPLEAYTALDKQDRAVESGDCGVEKNGS